MNMYPSVALVCCPQDVLLTAGYGWRDYNTLLKLNKSVCAWSVCHLQNYEGIKVG